MFYSRSGLYDTWFIRHLESTYIRSTYIRQNCHMSECRGSVLSLQRLALVLDHWKKIRAHRSLVALTYK